MLTVQPNFSQRIHSGQAFGSQSAIILVPKESNMPSVEDKKRWQNHPDVMKMNLKEK